MTTNPAVAGSILAKFGLAAVSIVGGVFATYRVVSLASRKQMSEGVRGQLRLYNASVRPEQDRLYVYLFFLPFLAFLWGNT
jgi:hypothetical protein